MAISNTLDTVPQEVLEQVAYFAATHTQRGPPSGIVPLLLVNRRIYARLSTQASHHLYGRIFAFKFDIRAVSRRLNPQRTTPQILTSELIRRFTRLSRIRTRSDAFKPLDEDGSNSASELIQEAYLMMLENEGKNEQQLCKHARFDLWLNDYWFHENGASCAVAYLRAEKWLPDTQERALAMWLFWFLLKPGTCASHTVHSSIHRDRFARQLQKGRPTLMGCLEHTQDTCACCTQGGPGEL
jgi:hypothetical protein